MNFPSIFILDCNNCFYTILSMNATLSRVNSHSHAYCLSLETVWEGPEIILLKFRGKTNYNIFAVILTQSASQLEACQQITHIQLSVPPHASLSLWKLFSRRRLYKYDNTSPSQALKQYAAICQEGNMELEKELCICLQMQRIHRHMVLKTTSFYRIQWLDEPAGECLNWKDLPSKH